MRSSPLVFVLTAFLSLPSGSLLAQSQEEDLRQKLEELEKGQAEIRRQLDEIRRLLQAKPAAPAAPARRGPDVRDKAFNLGDNPTKGNPEAAITLIEFTDYQCPYCGRHARDTHPRIESEYIDTGKVRYVLLDMPLESIHRQAFEAAEAAHCAGEQDRYWEMHDRLFAHQRNLEPWSDHAEALGLDVAAFTECLESGRYSDSVRQDMNEARKAGVNGTPSFVIGRTDPEDSTKVLGISTVRGAQPFSAFQAILERALSETEEPADDEQAPSGKK